ncbi:MAG: hypothetical protein IJE60_03425 [Tyzzerella sp.]|nr:hypothetical protein [Tyzzerella sp.]
MTESFVLIKENYHEVYNRYISITGSVSVTNDEEEIICDDMKFEDKNGWCLITLLYGDSFAEEILLELSGGNELLYFYSDDVQMDCEFLAVSNNNILRKKYIYADTPELDEDEGYLHCEAEKEFKYWNDIDYMIEIAKNTPDEIFKL